MPLSMYQASVPVFVRVLGVLSKVLDKGAAFAEARSIDPSVLVNARLAPDMLPLSRQVQIAGDMVMRGAARLAGQEFPNTADTEKTFPELQERIAKTLRFLDGFTAAQIDGSEERNITVKFGDRSLTFTGQDYLLNFVLPNLYFHVAAAYLILRHNGVELGKRDFLGM
ncbi:MAG: DUF1993 domain-containing protein [Methyloceanibacter sp.]|uniref:DUF1993 domain-containing protein n=1 Tax=Methyloceanibacter sp. TaxID=1965321 RepID=UPI003D6C9311